ncbi:MAG: hypothetical protein QM756_03180 [Polyangiaceae bacterium]
MSIRKIAALIPVCALFAACGGDATPEAKAPEGGAAAAEEAKPADAKAEDAKPADGADKPAEGGDAKPEGEAK